MALSVRRGLSLFFGLLGWQTSSCRRPIALDPTSHVIGVSRSRGRPADASMSQWNSPVCGRSP